MRLQFPLALLVCLLAAPLSAQPAYRVKDITPLDSFPTSFTQVGATTFFSASDASGTELWKSDGTPSGTVLVKDINPGANGSNPGVLANVNGTLFFEAFTNANGSELWKSDGTAAGTVLVKDIVAGADSSLPTELTAVGSTLFFVAFDTATGAELWKSN